MKSILRFNLVIDVIVHHTYEEKNLPVQIYVEELKWTNTRHIQPQNIWPTNFPTIMYVLVVQRNVNAIF